MDDDIIADLFARFRSVSTGLPDDLLWQLQCEAREAWGGQRLYVRKMPTEDVLLPVAAATLSTGGTVREVFEKCRVGKTKGYGMLSRRWPPR